MVTSNLLFSRGEQILKDPTMTAAASAWLGHHGVIVELIIPGYRLEKAMRSKQAEG